LTVPSVTSLDIRPTPDEHAAFALTYVNATEGALQRASTGSVLKLLAGQMTALHALIAGVSDETLHRGYAPGKWTLAESLVHVADVERVFAYRLLRVARGDKTPLPGFDHDAWVPESRTAGRSLADILTELDATRASTLALVRSIDERAAAQVGTASGNPISVRALAWMIAGHFAHHLEITRTRYLGGV
jgi:uncharacterized damage-inducible protein DinB